ncbi:DUF7507 domain-containing protein [Aliigemmobacter aestuarii]
MSPPTARSARPSPTASRYAVTDTDSVTLTAAQQPAITLDKTADVATYGTLGETITYSFEVENTGNVTLTNVSVTDPLTGLSAITPAPVSLAPGASQIFTATLTVTQDHLDAGVADAMNPVQNIKGGVAYLDWLMKEFDRDPLMVLAAYNAGEGAVRANDGVPPYAETRDYVPKVLAAWQVAQGLCLTPPELVTDPCVFKVISAEG